MDKNVDPARDLVPWAFVVLAIFFVSAPSFEVSGSWLWLSSAFLFGLPHGACDHLVAVRLFGGGVTPSRAAFVTGFFLAYLALGALMFSAWVLAPEATLVFFLILAAWHWGSADAATFSGGFSRFIARSSARGAMVISAPVVFHPEASLDAFSTLTDLFGSPTTAPWIQAVAAACLAAAVSAAAALAARDFLRKDFVGAAREPFETSLLLALMYFAPPIAAVGVYFLAWHSWRHVLRAERLLDPGRSVLASVYSYHKRAAPLTAVSVIALVAIAFTFGTEDAAGLVALYIVVLSALTVPHAALTLAWDARKIRKTPVDIKAPVR